jgi:hypothetical protein
VLLAEGVSDAFNSQSSQKRLIKSAKNDIKKYSSKKAVLIVRRIINEKGQHTDTEVDIRSRWLAQVMQKINGDVEGLSLKKFPPCVCTLSWTNLSFLLTQT